MKHLIVTLWLMMVLMGCNSLNTSDDTSTKATSRVDQAIADRALVDYLKTALTRADPGFTSAHLGIHAQAGIVLFVGQVASPTLKAKATTLASKDAEVTEVHNHLTIEPNSSLELRANDAWLAAKVRSRLFTQQNFNSGTLMVVVEKGMVYLMGQLSQAEIDLAIQLTSQVEGVQKIITVLTQLTE